jgi:transposase
LGVDDWALRRGQIYGTILVDLESHQVIDLLPERSAESFASWLSRHPEVEIIARDRGEQYTQGAAVGAPRAVQVADRWHLLHNLHEALVRVIERFPRELRDTARQAAIQTPPPELSKPPPADPAVAPPAAPPLEQTAWPRSPRWQEKYQRLLELQQQHYSQRAMARELGLDRSTVQRWIKAGCLPSLSRRGGGRPGGVAKWHEYLEARWQAGCHNAATLTAELQAQGYQGSYYPVRRWVARWRNRGATGSAVAASAPRAPSAKAVGWWFFKAPVDRDADQQRFLDLFSALCPAAAQAASLAIEFHDLMRKRDLINLADWFQRAMAPEIPMEMQRFAKGLQSDLAAIHAAFSLPWSNGQTEGQVNRLKLIKRQMFGRAKFDLLRQRVLACRA